MSTIKISQLNEIPNLGANTSATVFVGVDLANSITGKITGTTLARYLYANNVLNVGGNPIVYDHVIGQFAGNSSTYLQVNLQNFDSTGSSDFVASTSDSDGANSYIDMGINGRDYYEAAFNSMRPYDGYLYVHGPSHTSNTGNLVIGTASAGANIVLTIGGTEAGNIIGYITKKGIALIAGGYITFPDGTAIKSGNYSNSAFAKANAVGSYAESAYAQANATNNYAVSGYAFANATMTYAQAGYAQSNTNATNIQGTFGFVVAANNLAQSAYTKANNALANTSGALFAGDLNVSGNVNIQGTGNTSVEGTLTLKNNLTVNGTVVLANTNFSATESAMTIKATDTVALPSNDGYMLHISGKQDVPSRIVFDSYGTSGQSYGLVAGRTARGTVTAPSAVANGDILMRISGNGYGTTGWAPLGIARIDIVAAEDHTDANRGSRIEMWNMAVGSNTLQKIASYNGDSVTFSGVVSPQKGFVYTPRIPVGNQTAITIDFANDSMIKANLTADLSVTLSNFVHGKVVEMWLTNAGGFNRTVTHGCFATNSTKNAVSFVLQSGSSAYLRYFSIDGNLANTFVSIVNT
jgi:hypothetical protein